MANIELTKVKANNEILYLKFQGSSSVAEGKANAEYIESCIKKYLVKFWDIRGIIFDFLELDYEASDAFVNFFLAGEEIFGKKVLLSAIPNDKSLPHWKSLLESDLGKEVDPEVFFGIETSIFQDNLDAAINSINRRLLGVR